MIIDQGCKYCGKLYKRNTKAKYKWHNCDEQKYAILRDKHSEKCAYEMTCMLTSKYSPPVPESMLDIPIAWGFIKGNETTEKFNNYKPNKKTLCKN